jgi:hypothetical protein
VFGHLITGEGTQVRPIALGQIKPAAEIEERDLAALFADACFIRSATPWLAA